VLYYASFIRYLRIEIQNISFYLCNIKNITHLKNLQTCFFALCLSALLIPGVSVAQSINATGTVTNVLCHGDSTGSIAYEISGGVGAVHYVWNTGDSGNAVSGCTYIVHITNVGPALTAFQVSIPVTLANGMNANFSNVQFTDTTGAVLPFWLQDFPTATTATFWVRVPNLPIGTTNIYLTFCGTAAVAGNPNGTFEFFDNFDNNTLPLWTQTCVSSMAGTSCAITADNTVYFSPGYSAHLHGGSTCFTPPYSGAGASISRTVNPIVNDSLVLDYEDKVATSLYGFCSGGTGTTNSAQDNGVSIGNGQSNNHGGSCATSTSGWAAETSQPFVVSTGTTTILLEEHGGDCDNSDGWFDDVRIRKYTAHPPTVVIDTSPHLVLNHLAAGTYVITLTNGGTVATDTFIVTQPTAVAPVLDSLNINCYGSPSGTAWITAPMGGTPSYTYHWSGTAQTTDTVTNLAAGQYQVTVTDHNGCTGTGAVSIIQPPSAVSAVADSVNISCFGLTNGKAWAVASGGTPGYTYQWSAGAQTTDTISNLGVGNYIVTVTDASHCAVTVSVNITQPASALTLVTDSVNVLCFGLATGQASVAASGGTPGYTYLWSNTGTTDTIKNILANAYTVTVHDTNGCVATATVNVTQPATAVSVTMTHTDITCVGLSNGTAQAVASNGTGGYTYLWNSGQTNDSLTGLHAVTEVVTVTDANGCTTTGTVTIAPSTDSIVIDTVATPATCGQSNGTITANPTGGTGGYQFVWSTSRTSATIDSLSGGSYDVTVTDNSGCTASRAISISQSPAVTASVTTQNDTCNQQKGTVYVTALTGTAPYSLTWSPAGIDTAKLDSGSYTVTITDAVGCTATQTFTIENISDNCKSLVVFPTAFTPNGDNVNDTLTILYTPDLEKFQMRIYDRWGQLVFETSDVTRCWTGTFKNTAQPTGVYIWFAEYNFKNKATQAQTGNVTLLR
jgi:gliding motility-associated-like protein